MPGIGLQKFPDWTAALKSSSHPVIDQRATEERLLDTSAKRETFVGRQLVLKVQGVLSDLSRGSNQARSGNQEPRPTS